MNNDKYAPHNLTSKVNLVSSQGRLTTNPSVIGEYTLTRGSVWTYAGDLSDVHSTYMCGPDLAVLHVDDMTNGDWFSIEEVPIVPPPLPKANPKPVKVTMNEIKVFYIIRPARYRAFIPEGRYPYTKTEASLPAMQTKWEVPVWKGAFFSTTQRIFVFAEHATKIAPTSPEFSKWAHSPGTKAHHIPGIIGLAAIGVNLIRAATTDTSDTEGFVFHYDSDDGQVGLCMATAPTSCVAEILASVPPDRIDPSIAPK
jgi:hypothetical protein